MVPADVLEVANKRVKLEVGGQLRVVQEQLDETKRTFNARGVLASGGYLLEVARICARAAEERCEIAWRIVHRAISTTGVQYSDGLEAQLKDFLSQAFGFGDLAGFPNQAAKLINMAQPEMLERLAGEVAGGRSRGMARMNNEVELFVRTLKAAERAVGDRGGHTFNVYAPVGAIQTGAGSTATTSQTINMQEAINLDNALAELEAAVNSSDALPTAPRNEVIEIIEDTRRELHREKPNASTLKALLSGTAETVRTVAALKPAYEAVKVVAAAAGIPLP
jgi:hypothetical protein